jgi:hypothetical protein
MPDTTAIPNQALDQLLDWLAEADTASSHDGFTYTEWLGRKPRSAIASLSECRRPTQHG